MNDNRIKVIAEIGINHDGSIEKAKKLINGASDSDVDAVKFQYRNLENVYSETDREIGDEILLAEIKKNYLSPEAIINLTDYAKSKGLEVGISFFDESDILDFGKNIGEFSFFKIPSVELTNTSLIDSLLNFNRHIYISLGAHYEGEIEKALSRLPDVGWTPLHCVSNYPVAIQNPRLGYIDYLKDKWDREIGYSSHDEHWEICLLAMHSGAKVIERHITLDRKAEGLDHSSSSTISEFKKLTSFAKNEFLISSGNTNRAPNQGELLNRQNLGRSYFAFSDLPCGHILKQQDIVYRSPNIGIDKTDINDYLSMPIRRNVNKGAPITKSTFGENNGLSERVIEFSRQSNLSLPIRFHDMKKMELLFPIGAFEFHLSYGEVLSDIDIGIVNPKNRYSIHLPDYANSTQLMDPFSKDLELRNSSLKIIEHTVELAEKLQNLTGLEVPIVGSFSIVHSDRKQFYESYSKLFNKYRERGVSIVLQWLPPIAWYFGGSVNLDVMNNLADATFIHEKNMGVCLDFCHLILGRNYYGFSEEEVIGQLNGQVQHIHIADAIGIDGEGLAIGEGDTENLKLFDKAFTYDCLKVVEVWQGHFDNGAGFRKALIKLTDLYENS